MKAKIYLIHLLTFFGYFSYAQINNYENKAKLIGVKDQYHKITLPSSIFKDLNADLSDLRIIGINQQKDTLEAPYFLKIESEKIIQKEIQFKLINQSKTSDGHYFTFEIPGGVEINEVNLSFGLENFDWKVNLEGSQEQLKWFKILENYRIVSLKNSQTEFKFSKLIFLPAQFRYFRLFIPCEASPEFKAAKIFLNTTAAGKRLKLKSKILKTSFEKESKQSRLIVDLDEKAPVNSIKINVNNTFDYYRPITIEYLIDSIKIGKKWNYNYETLSSGILNSVNKNEFKFDSQILKKIKITIENNDNEALDIDSISLSGDSHTLIARLEKDADYYLYYGNKNSPLPQYDLAHFADKIPDSLSYLEIENIQKADILKQENKQAFFENKFWLWGILLSIIGLMGYFSLKMIKEKQNQ
jgi:Protein of unknown function (DUF3999)